MEQAGHNDRALLLLFDTCTAITTGLPRTLLIWWSSTCQAATCTMLWQSGSWPSSFLGTEGKHSDRYIDAQLGPMLCGIAWSCAHTGICSAEGLDSSSWEKGFCDLMTTTLAADHEAKAPPCQCCCDACFICLWLGHPACFYVIASPMELASGRCQGAGCCLKGSVCGARCGKGIVLPSQQSNNSPGHQSKDMKAVCMLCFCTGGMHSH